MGAGRRTSRLCRHEKGALVSGSAILVTGILRQSAVFDGFDLYARRAIRAGEELTFDYGEDWL